MARNKKVGIIGHFGGQETFLDGQTVKTKILWDELSKVADWKLKKVDTYYRRKNPAKLLWDTFACLCSCKDVFILLSGIPPHKMTFLLLRVMIRKKIMQRS